MSRRIYPVPIKPASGIRDWSGWPDDVRETIRAWNKGRGLTFAWMGLGDVFKCTDCERFCEPQPHGTVRLNGDLLCDDCTVARARDASEATKRRFAPSNQPA